MVKDIDVFMEMVKDIDVLWDVVFVICMGNKYEYSVRDVFVIYEKYVWISCERCNL